jgi:exodeoxyribonuclease VII large subunit
LNKASLRKSDCLKRAPNASIYSKELKHLNTQLHQNMAHSLSGHTSKLGNQAKALHILSPLSTLSRGYSITHNEKGSIVHVENEINVGDVISTTLHQGKLLSKVYDKKDS